MTDVAPVIIALDEKRTFPIGFGRHLEFEYTNHKGERETRRICVHRVYWGATKYHPQPQWIMGAHDMHRREDREFAMRDMVDVRKFEG